MRTWSPDLVAWQAAYARVLRWVVIATFVTSVPVFVVYLIAPTGSTLQAAASWYYVITFVGGLIGGSALYVGLRGLAHRQLHYRLWFPTKGAIDYACPWCTQEREWHTLPSVVRESRDRLREKLQRAEFRD